ncbi:HEAT repeat domain-containing protein [Streptomyces decoyicus]|uniref:HEAT repeat domain-containing protein n=1 Tax=Streptomyces decoyicus TaxID=249567 RepID=UPI0033CD7BC3
MATTQEMVRHRLDVDEPDYPMMAREFGSPAADYLRVLLDEEDELLASKAVYLAGLIPAESAVDILAAAADNASPIVRVAAAASLANKPGLESAPLLEALLDDDDIGVRKTALRTAGKLRAASVRGKIEAMAQSDSHDALRQLARETLSHT